MGPAEAKTGRTCQKRQNGYQNSGAGSYLGYLQQYTHNINLMRWFLDAGDKVTVQSPLIWTQTDIPALLFSIWTGVRVTLETGHVSHYRWGRT